MKTKWWQVTKYWKTRRQGVWYMENFVDKSSWKCCRFWILSSLWRQNDDKLHYMLKRQKDQNIEGKNTTQGLVHKEFCWQIQMEMFLILNPFLALKTKWSFLWMTASTKGILKPKKLHQESSKNLHFLYHFLFCKSNLSKQKYKKHPWTLRLHALGIVKKSLFYI